MVGQKGSCCDSCHQLLCPYFPLKGFIVLYLCLSPTLNLFLCMVFGSVLIAFFTRGHPVFPALLTAGTLFSVVCFASSVLGHWPQVSFWTSCPAPLICVFVFLPAPHCLGYCGFYRTVWIWGGWFLQLWFFFLKLPLDVWGLLCFHINCRIFSSNSVQRCHW